MITGEFIYELYTKNSFWNKEYTEEPRDGLLVVNSKTLDTCREEDYMTARARLKWDKLRLNQVTGILLVYWLEGIFNQFTEIRFNYNLSRQKS